MFVACFNLYFWFDSCLFFLNNFIGFVFYSSVLCLVLLYSVDSPALLLVALCLCYFVVFIFSILNEYFLL